MLPVCRPSINYQSDILLGGEKQEEKQKKERVACEFRGFVYVWAEDSNSGPGKFRRRNKKGKEVIEKRLRFAREEEKSRRRREDLKDNRLFLLAIPKSCA